MPSEPKSAFDRYDEQVIKTLKPGMEITGGQLRDKYRDETTITNKHTAKERAKLLTKADCFEKVGWGTWRFNGVDLE